MYTVNVRAQLIHSFISITLAEYVTSGGGGGGFSTTTSLALCLANSLIQCDLQPLGRDSTLEPGEGSDGVFYVRHQAAEYIRWWRDGHFPDSPTPSTPDGALQAALQIWEDGLKRCLPTAEILELVRSGQHLQLQPHHDAPAGASAVWVLPIALLFWRDTPKASELARAAADVLAPASRDLAGWYVYAVTSVLWNWAAKSTVRLEERWMRVKIEDEYQRLRLHGVGGADDVHRGVEIYMETETFGEGLSVARRHNPQVAMAYAGIAAIWYGAAVGVVDRQAFVGYDTVERVAGALGTLAKKLEKKEDEDTQILASSIPLDDEYDGML